MSGALVREQITGLVLTGGRGSRMGGVDKGLQLHRGQPLAQHALQRLRPQVGALMINANRNLDAYRAMGVPVWPDPIDGFAGPLAGLLAGLAQAQTDWLASVPCDSPDFPLDLVARLAAAAAAQNADVAVAATRADGAVVATRAVGPPPAGRQLHPVFMLLRCTLRDSLAGYLAAGDRQVGRWTAQQRVVEVLFDDAAAFFNANTEADLRSLQR